MDIVHTATIAAPVVSASPNGAWLLGLIFLALCFGVAWKLNGTRTTLGELLRGIPSEPTDRELVERAYAGVDLDGEERERAIQYATRAIETEEATR